MMEIIQLVFKNVGNHWYLDIPHDNPSDLCIDPVLERMISKQDKWKSGIVNNIYLIEMRDVIIPEGLIQFDDNDLLRYFTTNEKFQMNLYINNHKFKISSQLYTLMEKYHHLDLHEISYRIKIF